MSDCFLKAAGALSCLREEKIKKQHYLGLQSNARVLRRLTGRLSADCWQNKRAAVSPVRGTNIDMLQWPAMLIKYMLIEIQ